MFAELIDERLHLELYHTRAAFLDSLDTEMRLRIDELGDLPDKFARAAYREITCFKIGEVPWETVRRLHPITLEIKIVWNKSFSPLMLVSSPEDESVIRSAHFYIGAEGFAQHFLPKSIIDTKTFKKPIDEKDLFNPYNWAFYKYFRAQGERVIFIDNRPSK